MTAKEAVQAILDNTDPSATYEEIMYQIFLREKIEHGLKDIETGNLATQEEVEAVFGKWDQR